MRVIDDLGREVEPDLVAGYLVEDVVIKLDVAQVDDVDKFAYDDGDYESVMRYVPYTQTVVEPDQTERLASALSNATSLSQVREAAKTILRG